MNEKSFYNKEEVDEMFNKAKNDLLTKIEEQIHYGATDAGTPTQNPQTLSIKILKTES